MKYIFFLPRFQKYEIIKATDESKAVWKLLNKYRLRENEISDYKLIEITTANLKF